MLTGTAGLQLNDLAISSACAHCVAPDRHTNVVTGDKPNLIVFQVIHKIYIILLLPVVGIFTMFR